MENTNTDQKTQPQGKGMGTAGFVISLIGLVFYLVIAFFVAAAAVLGGGYGLSIFWLIVCLSGTILSIMGMIKLGKTGGKRGLAITGMILGIVATIFSAMLVMGVDKMQHVGSDFGDKFHDAMNQAGKNMTDSLAKGMHDAADSIAKHQ